MFKDLAKNCEECGRRRNVKETRKNGRWNEGKYKVRININCNGKYKTNKCLLSGTEGASLQHNLPDWQCTSG